MTKFRLWTSWASAMLTIIICITLLMSVLVIFSTALCAFTIGIIGFVVTCVFLIPVLILGTSKLQDLTSASDLELYRLLLHARNITIKTDNETLTLKSNECYFRVSNGTGITYINPTTGSYDFYNIVEGLCKGHKITIDNVQLVLI